MTNLRDGGIIIVGVSERGESWSLDGISNQDFATYDEDNVNDFVNKYASPSIRVELVRVPHNGVSFLAIKVPEFEWSPIVCKRNGADISKLRKTSIYVRTGGKPQTIPASDVSQIDELLELAAEKHGRGPVDFKISRGALDKSLVEFKLASNTKLQQNLEKQVEVYKSASDAPNALKAILYFSDKERSKVFGILRALGLEESGDIVLIDGRADNKPSGSRA